MSIFTKKVLDNENFGITIRANQLSPLGICRKTATKSEIQNEITSTVRPRPAGDRAREPQGPQKPLSAT